MSMTLANKRRRLDNNAAILSKPFRPPLKVTKQIQQSTITKGKASDVEQQENIRTEGRHLEPISTQHAIGNVILPSIPTVTQLQKDYATTVQQLQHRRQTLDILQRAIVVRTSDHQQKLDVLLTKWQAIARDAADEVFRYTSARVKDFGGLQALKRHSREAADNWFDARDKLPSSDGHDDSEQIENENVLSPIQKSSEVGRRDGNEESHYHMAMMLRHFQIDPNLLGFNQEFEQWQDQD